MLRGNRGVNLKSGESRKWVLMEVARISKVGVKCRGVSLYVWRGRLREIEENPQKYENHPSALIGEYRVVVI